MSPRLEPAPAIAEPARAALVTALRKLIAESPFDTLDKLSDQIAGRPGKGACADNGDQAAAWELARLLAGRGDLDTLTTRADNGDQAAAWELALRLGVRRDVDALTTRADNGDRAAAQQLDRLHRPRRGSSHG